MLSATKQVLGIAELAALIASFVLPDDLEDFRASNRALRNASDARFYSSRSHLITVHSLRALHGFVQDQYGLLYLQTITLSCRQPDKLRWKQTHWEFESDYIFEQEGLRKMMEKIFARLCLSGRKISLRVDDKREQYQYGRKHWNKRLAKVGAEDNAGEIGWAIAMVLDALHVYPTVVRSLQLCDNRPCLTTRGIDTNPFLRAVVGNFWALTSFSIKFARVDSWYKDRAAQKHFCNFASCAPNIRYVAFTGDYHGYYADPWVDDDFLVWISKAFSQHSLQGVQLRNLLSTTEGFDAFLRPHMTTIEQLELTSCLVFGGCWQRLLVSLKHWSCLTSVKLKLQRSIGEFEEREDSMHYGDYYCESFIFNDGTDELEHQGTDHRTLQRSLDEKLCSSASYSTTMWRTPLGDLISQA